MSSSPLPELADLARSGRTYAGIENGRKRRRIEVGTANDIWIDDNINLLSSSPDPLHGDVPPLKRALQDVTNTSNNRLPPKVTVIPKGNRSRRVVGSKNKASVPPLDPTKPTLPTLPTLPKKRGRPAGSKTRAPTRPIGQPRAGPHALPPPSPPVMQPCRRSRRLEEERMATDEVLPELCRQAARVQALLEDEEEEERPEDVNRAMDDQGFRDLDEMLPPTPPPMPPPPPPPPMPAPESAPRTRHRTVHRDGKTLGESFMAARTPGNCPEEFLLDELRTLENRCPHCSAYQYDNECREKKHRAKYWHCCADGKVSSELPTAGSDAANIEKLPDGEAKDGLRELEEKVKKELHSLMYGMEPDPENPGQQRRTEASKAFQKLIVTYNNVLSFCSEAAIVDKKHSSFSTFRAMGGVKHLLGAMLAEEGDAEKFCQIYQIDSSQETTERRLEVGEDLEQEKLLLLTRLMRDVNPYAKAYKTCGDRLREEPNPQARFALKQNEPDRTNKGTHNKPTSDEVAALIILPETHDSNHPLERDIIIQEQTGGLRSIPYWHAAYMALRYPLLFPHGEQSWNAKVPLRGFEGSKKLLARRRARPGGLLRHMEAFGDEDQIDPGVPDPETPEALAHQDQQLALFLFAGLLEKISREDNASPLALFGLPEPDINFNEYLNELNRLIREELELAPSSMDAEEAWAKLNADQRHAADSIVNAVFSNEFNTGQIFFLDGPGGTGKTFVQNTVMGKLRSEGHVVLAVASSGIAATLLDGGQTAHSRFKIPLDSNGDSFCNIKKGSDLAQLILRAKMIFWDESPMQRKYDMLAVSRTITDLCSAVDETIPFGGKVVCFCGDFRQCTPVCPGAKKGVIMNMNLKATPFWPEVTILPLTINMRLQDPSLSAEGKVAAAEFADEVLAIGNGSTVENLTGEDLGGKAPWRHGFIEDNQQLGLIKTIYPDLMTALPTAQYLGDRAILAIANVDVGEINKVCTNRLLGYVYYKYSHDRAKDDEDAQTYPPECFNHYDEASLPPHILHLKVGMPVMILRNIHPPVMCNGTRARILKVGKDVLEAEVIAGKSAGERILIPRVPLDSKDDEASRSRRKLVPVPFTRRQFPVRPAFAMTINKSQGQSLRYVGIDILTRECFSHGQLYVAISRVTKKCNLYLITPEEGAPGEVRWIRNIVWKEVLF